LADGTSHRFPILINEQEDDAVGMSSPRLLIGRRSLQGAYYMLTMTVAGRERIFTNDATVECVIEALRCSDREQRSRTLAWVVMPDHVHWLIQLGNGNISRCVQAFKSRSSRAIKLHLKSQSAVWQSGFYDHCVRSDQSLLKQANYLIENPVRAGLATKVGDYPYCWTRWPTEIDAPAAADVPAQAGQPANAA